MKPATIIISIRPLPRADDPQGHRRLRRLLKTMLRSLGFECVEVRESSKPNTATPAENAPNDA